MKNLILSLFVLVYSITFSQKIDYSNFDESLASKALAQSYLNFRDTFSHFSIDPSYKVSELEPNLDKYPELRIPKWSDYMYKNVSQKNCTQLITTKTFEHINIKQWIKENVKPLVDDQMKGKGLKEISYSLSGVLYFENLYKGTNVYFETYQEMGDFIINGWNKSEMHCDILRTPLYALYTLEKYNIKAPGIFSVCVKYDPNTKTTISSLNIFFTQ